LNLGPEEDIYLIETGLGKRFSSEILDTLARDWDALMTKFNNIPHEETRRFGLDLKRRVTLDRIK
jgi:hypothetical protein